MESAPKFVSTFAKEAAGLLKSKSVREPLFSRGTYQYEVKEAKKKETYFPFLQVSDEGRVNDCFCSCKTSESGEGCPHLAAAYLDIFNGTEEPLHVRFRKSLWNQLFEMEAKRSGYDADCLGKEDGKYVCRSKTKKELFWIEGLTPAAKKRLTSLIEKRVVETEETSIKFSNLPVEELARYKAGDGSHSLLYELSVWSDLAKWMMFLQDAEESYQIEFLGDAGALPDRIRIRFPQIAAEFYVFEEDWPEIIPSLATVESPLAVVEEEDFGIERIEFDPHLRSLQIIHRGQFSSSLAETEGISVGDWMFVEGKGFYRKRTSPLFENPAIPAEQIADVLSTSTKILQRFLPIHSDPIPARYRLFFDGAANLHIELYVLESGDMRENGADLFPPWAYLPHKGFYLIQDLLFEKKEEIIPKAGVPEFVNKHRIWLHQFPGFQTHLGSLEAHLTYSLTPDDSLIFEARLSFPEQFEEILDFQEWVYIKGSGFYMKKESRGRLPLHPGLTLKKKEIPSFLASHKDDLEQVSGFFSLHGLIHRTGLILKLNEEGLIHIVPKIEFRPDIDASKVKIFGDFAYLPGYGFSEIPIASRLPERYNTETVIPASQEAAFLAYELEPLKPYILEIDPHLQKPSHLQLKIRKIQRDRRKRKGEWLLDLIYESEFGAVDVFTIWDGFSARKKHLFSPAGLLLLKEPRFNWVRQIQKGRLDRKRGLIRLNTLEWIRLSIFEEIKPPKGSDPESQETRELLEELQRFETHRLFDVSQLQAQLRPYQETGLQWLWFLYCYGLSGLLCDDMGLGKTHQAMALLAAVIHEDPTRENKYLVVCPTSVIYHWQELLKRFLPELRVYTHYGLERSLEPFEAHYDLLLTSYGILRTGREDLRAYSFEVAIFDEIQIAKNAASQTHAALRMIHAKMRLGLTGTPIENRIRELKSLLDVVLPGYLPSEAVFRDLFVIPIEKFQEDDKKILLSRLIRPFILRRKKSEVLLDLPEKIEEISYCDLSEEQKQMYAETARALKDTVYADLRDNSKPVPYIHVFSALSKLKQICDHPSLIHGDIKKYQNHQSGKWDLFVELIHEARDSGQKVVVFSQYLDMLAIIEEYLKKKGIGFATIKGSTRDRSEQLRRFREDPACEIFTASLLAAGVGIDLTVASIVIHYDRWWNPAKENQATDRVHRIGQNRGVQVFKLVTKYTIEEQIHDLIERKKSLLDEVVSVTDADQINYLTREELLQVFETIFKENLES